MKADLHIHSSYSNDGEISIPDIIKLCREKDVDTFSITDHNGIGGSREARKLLTDNHDINFIPGIEIDCNYKGTDLHLLGYQVKLDNDDFDALERKNITLFFQFITPDVALIEQRVRHPALTQKIASR